MFKHVITPVARKPALRCPGSVHQWQEDERSQVQTQRQGHVPKDGGFPHLCMSPLRGYKGGWLLPLNRNTGNLGRGQDLQARVSSKDSTEGKTRRGRLNVSAIYFLISPCFCDSLKYRIWAFCFWLFQVPQEREQHLSKYIASTCSSLFAAKCSAQSCHCSSPWLAAG